MSVQSLARPRILAAISVTLFACSLLLAGRSARGDNAQPRRSGSEMIEDDTDLESADQIRERNRLLKEQWDRVDPQARYEFVVDEYHRLEAEKAHRALITPEAGPTWVSLGPTNGAGRMTAIAPHPTSIGTLYM